MNKKEIVVNDINVSECNAYKDKHCKNETSIMFTEYNLCSKFPNCYYKQLQKLKEENVKLKKALEEIKTFAKPIKKNTCFGMYCGFVDFVLETISEVNQ